MAKPLSKKRKSEDPAQAAFRVLQHVIQQTEVTAPELPKKKAAKARRRA